MSIVDVDGRIKHQEIFKYQRKVPNTTFKIRKGEDWYQETSEDYFKDKVSLVVSLPGAFTPT
tara:strand:- start:25625 stop:25810 length:186 start_codon:yes stop_codon:yes gene_type:complete